MGRIDALLPFPPSAYQDLLLPWERSSLRENLRVAEPLLGNVPCHLHGLPPVLTPGAGTKAIWWHAGWAGEQPVPTSPGR